MSEAGVMEPVVKTRKTGTAFSYTIETDGLATLVFDRPGEKVNVYAHDVILELESILDELGKRLDVQALLLVSGKPGAFIAGANVNEIAHVTPEEARAGVLRGQQIFQKLANVRFPTIAAIDGACVGGGCETVLAMDWRLASDSKKTVIGLPEIKLGIIPAWGGTTRLPRIIGLTGALDVILAGKTLDSKRAKRACLVDEVVPQPLLLEHARRFARGKFGTRKRSNAGSDGGPARVAPAGPKELLMEGVVGRMAVFSQARATVMKQTGGHYPAPLEALGVIENGFGRPFPEALVLEADAVARLVQTEAMKSLVSLFFRMEEVKKETGVPPGVKPRTIRRVGVLGAGAMGGGIAQLAADKGYPTRMKDIKQEQLACGYGQAAKIWLEKVRKRRLTRAELAGKMALLSGSLSYDGFGSCDITIEAVLEKLSVKQAVLSEWEAVSRPDAIFASNTSTLPITDIAAGASHPERVIGMHFFNPVHKMPLVEVIFGAKTAPEVTATVFDLAKRMGKTPVVVKDAPGFLVNRILSPYLGEAVRMLLEGVPMEAIDQAMRRFGMPVGPIELLDDVGIDVATKGSETLAAAFPERMPIDPAFGKMGALGRHGRKSNKGFYRYEKGSRAGADTTAYADLGLPLPGASHTSQETLEERLIYPMVNEAAFCLADGIVESPAKLDLAMIFGIGFPPFLGGLTRFADVRGLGAIVDSLEKLASSLGPRFKPSPYLVDLARSSRTFHRQE